MYSSQLLKGTFQTIILKLLNDHPKLYGYEISQMVKEKSDGNIQLPEGSLYPILHKMAEEGLVETEEVKNGRRIRRYYKLTKGGQEATEYKLEEFERFVGTMRGLLQLKTI